VEHAAVCLGEAVLPTRLFASVFFHRKAGQIVLEPR